MQKVWAMLLVLLLWGVGSQGVAHAAPLAVGSTVPQPILSRPSASDISSEKVSQFVQAYLQVLALIEQREGMLQGAETQPEAQQVEREIAAAALEMLEENGLTWQEYLQLLGLANSDPEFGERIAAQLQEAQL